MIIVRKHFFVGPSGIRDVEFRIPGAISYFR